MFTTKKTLKRLNSIIDALRSSISNKEVLDYILSNLDMASGRSVLIKIDESNKVMILDYLNDTAFYLDVKPSLDVIDEIHTRIVKAGGDYDERLTVAFDEDTISIHKYASAITKSKKEGRVIDITDTFEDKTIVDEELQFRKKFSTNVSYPLDRNAVASSDLEEVVIDSDRTGVFRKISLSSDKGSLSSFGLFDAIENVFSSNSNIDDLANVRTINEDEYTIFANKVDPKYTKELK